jgi:hypothetical protein
VAWDAARCHAPLPLPASPPQRQWRSRTGPGGPLALERSLGCLRSIAGASHTCNLRSTPSPPPIPLLPPRPPPPVAARGGSKEQAAPEPIDATEPTEPTSRRSESAEPQVVQEAKASTVALSSDPVERAKQLELLRSYGYDTSAL